MGDVKRVNEEVVAVRVVLSQIVLGIDGKIKKENWSIKFCDII